jgi:hypothetical protein
MFTMKKFAVLAITGFMASSMIGCSDDPDDDNSSSSTTTSSPSQGGNWETSDITSPNWSKKVTVTLGGLNSSQPSALDIDTLKTNSEAVRFSVGSDGNGPAKTHKNKVDLLFDGTNIFTPEGCVSPLVNSCPATFKTAMDGYVGENNYPTEMFYYPATTFASDSPLELYNKYYDSNGNTYPTLSKTLVTPVEQKPGGIYFMVTARGNYALILVNGGNYGGTVAGASSTLTILVAYKQAD